MSEQINVEQVVAEVEVKDIVKQHQDFMLFISCKNGNPNGDPDAGNLPRTDPNSLHGIISDVSIKHHIREYVRELKNEDDGYRILMTYEEAFSEKQKRVYEEAKLTEIKAKKTSQTAKDAKKYMNAQYFDSRIFGSVASTGDYVAANTTGAVQLSMAESLDPVLINEPTITSVARTEKAFDANSNTFGRKPNISYGLYVSKGHVNVPLCEKNGVTNDDLDLLYKSMINMYEASRSAAIGETFTYKLIVFKHTGKLCDVPSWKLFDAVHINKKFETDYPVDKDDYEITIDYDKIPSSVEVVELI